MLTKRVAERDLGFDGFYRVLLDFHRVPSPFTSTGVFFITSSPTGSHLFLFGDSF